MEEDVLPPNEKMEDLSSRNTEKRLSLEQTLTKIKLQLDELTESILMKLLERQSKRSIETNFKEE